MKTAIIIPSYNEAENIGGLLKEIFANLPQGSVVVVDDNSPDGTAAVVRRLQAKYKKLYLVVRKDERGRGSAVIAGFSYAKNKLAADLFIEMDADFSHDPKELPMLIDTSSKQVVVIGSRYCPRGKVVNWPKARFISSLIANWLIRLVLGLAIFDNTNGYRVYPPAAVSLLLKHNFVSHGYINLSEISYLLSQHGFDFIEVPTVFINRISGKSNATVKEFFDSIINLFRIRAIVR